jgi:hypothetical protein
MEGFGVSWRPLFSRTQPLAIADVGLPGRGSCGLLILVLLFIFFPSASFPTQRFSSSNAATPPRQSELSAVSSDRYFEFHSGFWINLHLFLYEEAVTRKGGRDVGREAEFTADSTISAGLSGDEKTKWDAAIAYYQANLIPLDLITNDKMRNIKNTLEGLEDAPAVSRAHLDPGLIRVLDNAAPIYRDHWWTAHDKSNRDWIAAVTPLADQNGGQLTQELSTAFETPWPDTPIRVDVVAYANSSGAFTTLHPDRITISSKDPANQKLTALEALFHEGSHTMDEKVGNLVFGYFASHKKTAPPDLLHALLYFTSGYLVKQIYPDYISYADGVGLWQQVTWTGYQAALVKDWQPHLEGKSTATAALSQLVADVIAASK